MKKRLGRLALFAAVGVMLASATVSGQANKEIQNFKKVWNDRKSTNLDKSKAIDELPRNKEVVPDYLTILESDVWQYRVNVMVRIKDESDPNVLAEYEKFLFDEKKGGGPKQPAAAEHVVWALYNNTNWVNADRWAKGAEIVKSKAYPEKVKARVIREMGGIFNRANEGEKVPELQAQGKLNVKTLVSLLEWSFTDKKFPRDLRFLIADALENLTSEEHGDTQETVDKWRFFADNLKPDVPLTPRKAEKFKDDLGDVELEGHSFARKAPRKGGDLDLLILPDLGKSAQYWYPYVFELNKTFNATFVDLPDCSRMKNLEWMKNQDGSVNRTAYYYPLAQLVEAFEQRRESSGKKRVGIIAHGVSGWIALEYLRLHPDSVEFAIIIQTWSGENSREQARNAMENNKEKDLAFNCAGQDLVYDPSGTVGSLSLNESQKMWAETGHIKRRWADHRGLEPIFFAQPQWRKPVGGNARILVPKFEFANENKGKKIDVPVLFCHGAKDPMYVAKDMQIYQRTFTKMKWVEFANSADTPWAEEPVKFFEEYEKLLADHKILEKLADGGNKKRK
ncbi:MAG: alpha/beta hydrolase [Planctomycetes bacterium]|nr:alpha/beta hydrolase [Planctomycetota bacterium]